MLADSPLKKLVPSRIGFIYHIERTERDLILLSLPSQGLYGWAPRESVVVYNEAEGYFTNELETKRPTPFAYLMRAIVCRDNDRIDNRQAVSLRSDPQSTR